MKVYTRTGDQGTTSLVGGTRVAKDDARLEAYGTIDELNSHLGLLTSDSGLDPIDRDIIIEAQKRLFDIGANLATEAGSRLASLTANPIDSDDIAAIEQAIDRLDAEVPVLKTFSLPGGTTLSAQAHVARTVCRRAERRVITLAAQCAIDPQIIPYINRISDYLFLLARAINHRADVPDIPWTPKNQKDS